MATNVENMVKDYYAAWNSHDVEKIISFLPKRVSTKICLAGLSAEARRK